MANIKWVSRKKHPEPLSRCPVCMGKGTALVPGDWVWGSDWAKTLVLATCPSCLGSGLTRKEIDTLYELSEERRWGRG